MLAIFDYKGGNQTSVRRALEALNIPNEITNDPAKLDAATGIIFPGVGAAGQAMDELKEKGLDTLIRSHAEAGKPILGICVGCQILLDYCEENDTDTLGIISGNCVMFQPDLVEEDGTPICIPHMGWNSIKAAQECALFEGIDPDAEFYFVHSYYPVPAPEFIVATTYYGREFCAMHGREGLWATQFHPEKSGRPGLKLLSNFYNYCVGVKNAE
ncbi:MAG: imidazole glycerol phosphate synthase subunit HisH [Desulfovibrio sp.]